MSTDNRYLRQYIRRSWLNLDFSHEINSEVVKFAISLIALVMNT